MTRRLLLSYLGLAVLILVVLEVPFGFIAARHEADTARAQATRDATEIAIGSTEVLESGNQRGLQALVEDYFSRTGAEVAIADAGGRLIAADDPDRDGDVIDHEALLEQAVRGRTVSLLAHDEGHPTAASAVPIGSAQRPLGAVLIIVAVSAYTDRSQDVWIALAGFGLAVLVLTTLVGLGLARSLTRPLAVLEGTVARFGGGDLSSRVPPGLAPQEMESLAESFNRMAQRLEELVSVQSRFVADASHQLRSPLTALRLRLENLEAELDEQTGEALAAAGREVLRLSRLVDGLLVLSRADGFFPDLQPVDVALVIAERCDAWSALAAERRISLVDRIADRRATAALLVPGDLDQILDNLLANALDAAPGGTSIEVVLEPGARRDRLVVHVVDEGPGMSEDDRARAFDRFWQGPGRRGGHSGLGLAIVRQLAQRNGAEVELQAAPSGGLDVIVTLRGATDRAASPAKPRAPVA
ncbi:MAG: sensor histidine kinase [Acidimicrobiales bacterium]